MKLQASEASNLKNLQSQNARSAENRVWLSALAVIHGRLASAVNRGQLMPSRERDDQVAMTQRRWTPSHDQAFMGRPHECSDGRFDLAGVTQINRAHLHPE